MVDRSAQGAVGAPFDLQVETGKIREYAKATYARHADYFLADDAPIHPHQLVTRLHWETPEAHVIDRVKLDYARGLHAGQTFTFHGPPPRAGDRLVGRTRIDRIYDKHSPRSGLMTFFDMVTDFRDRSGRLVAEMNTISLEMAETVANQPAPARADKAPPPPEDDFAEPGPAPLRVVVSRTDLVRYAGASGDFNPVHHDEIFARKAGYDTTLAMGMFQAGLCGSWAADWLGPRNVRRTGIRFVSRVFPGDELTVHGGIVKRYVADGVKMVDVAITCRKGNGEIAIRSEMTFTA